MMMGDSIAAAAALQAWRDLAWDRMAAWARAGATQVWDSAAISVSAGRR
jgi:hypothetical protein